MGYGQIVGGMKQSAAAKRRGSGSRVVSKYRAERDAITAKADTFEAVAHSAVSLHKGYSEGQSQWANLEEGAAELGLEGQIADKRAGAGRWEKWTGPSKKTLDEMVTGDAVDGKQLEISYGELKTMGKIKRTQGARYLKTMDPTTGEYKDVKDSGWGQMKDVPVEDTTETAAAKDPGKKSYSNFPIAESLIDKTGETLGNIQGSLSEWWSNTKADLGIKRYADGELDNAPFGYNQNDVNVDPNIEYSETGRIIHAGKKSKDYWGKWAGATTEGDIDINASATSDVVKTGEGSITESEIPEPTATPELNVSQSEVKPPVTEKSELDTTIDDYLKGAYRSGEPGAIDPIEEEFDLTKHVNK